MTLTVESLSRLRRPGGEARTPVGAFTASSDPSTTAILGSVGFDFTIIDCEHGALGVRDALAHVRSAQASGIVPLVRVLANRPELIQQALDIGAHGVVVPKVSSAEDARRAVAAARYQPGGRGMCPGVPATDFRLSGWAEHAAAANDSILVVPLIETAAGVENAAEIASVEGIELLFFGLADLAQDLGIDWIEDGPQLVRIWEGFSRAVRAKGKSPGAPGGFGFGGAEFVVGGMDLTLLRTAAEAELAALSGKEK